jgi:hypothetical protein
MTTNFRPNEIPINRDDPWADDRLNRKSLADFLTKALAAQPGGCVVNLDGPWGSGKSFFVARWAASLRSAHPTVVFNAWEADTGGDPLASLIADMKSQLQNFQTGEEAVRKGFVQLVKRSGPLLSALAPAVGAGLARKYLGNDGWESVRDVVAGDTETDIGTALGKAATDLVENEIARRQSTTDFRREFQTLVESVTKGQGVRTPMFVFIDELDRCRPTYAIEVLECVKHLFSSPNSVFVVATDTDQLRHSVCAVYGANFDGDRYLRRFFDVTCRLPGVRLEEFVGQLSAAYPLIQDDQTPIPSLDVPLLAKLAHSFKLTIRDLEQCHLRIRAVISNLGSGAHVHWLVLSWLVMAQSQCSSEFTQFAEESMQLSALVQAVSEKCPDACNEVPGHVAVRTLEHSYGKDTDALRLTLENVAHWRGDVRSEVRKYVVDVVKNGVSFRQYVRRVILAGALA